MFGSKKNYNKLCAKTRNKFFFYKNEKKREKKKKNKWKKNKQLGKKNLLEKNSLC